jgi:hypothetical protein
MFYRELGEGGVGGVLAGVRRIRDRGSRCGLLAFEQKVERIGSLPIGTSAPPIMLYLNIGSGSLKMIKVEIAHPRIYHLGEIVFLNRSMVPHIPKKHSYRMLRNRPSPDLSRSLLEDSLQCIPPELESNSSQRRLCHGCRD